ncbi:MAG: cbb3-type cytochrome oxidase assembly protein CcoS [Myxococcota bacterium]|nr:cbb3-type cytochrome oxidase assembly protein CcoS [Myxococcota bacterium]
MFVPLWLIFLATGLIMAVATVVWAVRTNQFEDQQRARFIPLRGLDHEALTRRPSQRFWAHYAGMWAVVAMGVAAMGAALILTVKGFIN